MSTISTTIDGLLNSQVQVEQPSKGFRIAIDTVLLAAAVPAKTGEDILDLGCGVGGAMLCVSCRVRGVKGLGLEIQEELVNLCRNNILRNAFAKELEVWQTDATSLPDDLTERFDQAFMNPPYHENALHEKSSNVLKGLSNTETGGLDLWISSAAAALKPGGMLTLIHKADRLQDVLGLLQKHFGEIGVLPLISKKGRAPKRVIVGARKGGNFFVNASESFVLHQDTGVYTPQAEAVLRRGEALRMAYTKGAMK